MSVQAKQEKKRGAVHKLWRSTARLATPKEKEKEKQRAAGHMSMAVGGTSSAASHSDYRRTQMLLQPNARSSLSSAWGNVSDSKQDSSFMPLLLRMLAEADLSEEAIWAGDERLFELLANFKEDLQESAHSGGCVVRFNLPMNIEEFAQSGSSSKSYKINPNLPVRQLLTMICRRLRINKPPENYQLRTLRGYPLRDECPLSMYGLGSLFASWELNVLLRLPSASDSLVAAITATTSTSTSTSTSSSTSSASSSSTDALQLYARILRLHRRKLPAAMRTLGDAYVREEFRRHASVSDRALLAQFFTAWEQYLETLELQKGEIGRDLSEAERASLSEDQQLKLGELRHHSRQPRT